MLSKLVAERRVYRAKREKLVVVSNVESCFVNLTCAM